MLRLEIGRDQPPWCPSFDGDVRVSSIQTGHRSGPLGSRDGQHRFRDGLTVTTELPTVWLFTPHHCTLEMRARAHVPPQTLAALWLIGIEDAPERSGEITVVEIFGDDVDPRTGTATVVHGIKPIHDPTLTEELHRVPLQLDPGEWHTYAIDWRPDGVRFIVDGAVVSTTVQSPDYPMQLMLNVYDLSGIADRIDRPWMEVDHVRAWR